MALGRETPAALEAPPFEHGASGPRPHAESEPMALLAPANVGLIGALHGGFPKMTKVSRAARLRTGQGLCQRWNAATPWSREIALTRETLDRVQMRLRQGGRLGKARKRNLQNPYESRVLGRRGVRPRGG